MLCDARLRVATLSALFALLGPAIEFGQLRIERTMQVQTNTQLQAKRSKLIDDRDRLIQHQRNLSDQRARAILKERRIVENRHKAQMAVLKAKRGTLKNPADPALTRQEVDINARLNALKRALSQFGTDQPTGKTNVLNRESARNDHVEIPLGGGHHE